MVIMNEEFWNNAFEVLRIILPSIITGIFTFFITKYGYHRNIPLDKLEISYNRVYYPICCLIKNEKDVAQVVKKCELHFKKYRKYIDRSTRIAFNYLKDTNNLQHKYSKKAYDKFKNNIFAIDSNLRRRLGYLEPNIIYLYVYAPPFEKRILRICVEYLSIYMFSIIILFFQEGTIKQLLNATVAIVFIAFFLEIVLLVIQFIGKGINKLTERFHLDSNKYVKDKETGKKDE